MRTVRYDSREHYRDKVFPSPFHTRQKQLNQNRVWSRWFDYLSVPAYTSATTEYFAGRNACGVFDITPMTSHLISGPDAEAYLNRLLTRDVTKVRPGRVGYCIWCTDEGQVIDDGTLFHLRPGVYRLCSLEHQIDWLTINALGFDVNIAEDTHDVAGLALQGPTSCATLKRMGLEGVEGLKPFDLAFWQLEGAELMVSRTGYTGDLGYELWIDPEHAEPLWDRLFEAGELHNIRPMGSDALDMLRIEAGLLLAGEDFMPAMGTVRHTHTRSPFELGLGWLVDFSKPNFNGRRALLEEQATGSRYAMVRLDIEDNKPANHSFVFADQHARKKIGWVTSAMWSPSAKKNIAFATVNTPHGAVGETIWVEIYYQRELQWSRKMARAVVVKEPFWDPPRRRQTPPADW